MLIISLKNVMKTVEFANCTLSDRAKKNYRIQQSMKDQEKYFICNNYLLLCAL